MEKLLTLKCVVCGHELGPVMAYACPLCGNILNVTYHHAQTIMEKDLPLSSSYAMMPVEKAEVSGIGVTPTPIVHAQALGERLGLKRLYFKCEMANLTGSFKDRPVSIAVAMAKRLGFGEVVAASSGNAAAATAACAARYGLKSVILVPAATPPEKVMQTAYYGARLFKVEGPYSNCYRMAQAFSEEVGACNVTTTFLNPYSLEGDKLVGYELYEALGEFPDAVYVPVGAGPLLVGIHRGLKEYADYLNKQTDTQMMAVQAQGNSPIAKAFAQGKSTVDCEHSPCTIAGGIADGLVGYEHDGEYTLRICRETGGAAVAVSDEQIKRAQRHLAELEGLFVEPSAAASLAAIEVAAEEGRLSASDLIVAVLTGHGLKDMKAITTERDVRLVQSVKDMAEEPYSK